MSLGPQVKLEIRRLINEEIQKVVPSLIEKAVKKAVDEIKMERILEEKNKNSNNDNNNQKRMTVDSNGNMNFIDVKNNDHHGGDNKNNNNQIVPYVTDKQMQVALDKKINNEVMPIIKTLANYVKVTLVDGDDIVTEYRREQFSTVKGRPDDMNPYGEQYKKMVNILGKDGKLPVNTPAPKTNLENILMLN